MSPGGKAGNAEKAAQIESHIARLQAEHTVLSTAPHIGLSDEQALSLERFAAEVRAGIGKVGPADRREIFELLQLRGVVSVDPKGIRLARANRFRIQWTAIIGLRSRDSTLTNIQRVIIGQPSAPAPKPCE